MAAFELQHTWIVDGAPSEINPPANITWPAAQRSGALIVDTDILPYRVELRSFDSLGPEGIPLDEPQIYECAEDPSEGSPCTYAVVDGRTTILLESVDVAESVLLLASLSWFVPQVDLESSGAYFPDNTVVVGWGLL